MFGRIALSSCLVLIVAATARAQFDNQWVEFVKDQTRLADDWIKADADEKDYAVGDIDLDGDLDVVVVRKEPAATLGKRINALLMNENATLVDRTALYAVDSDVPGDLGFLTPTNDRDVQMVDLDLDGWPDLITSVTLSDGAPKYISHPRVYVNKGAISGVWQGLRYEDARFPQLFTVGGVPVAPRFCSVAAKDVTGDGYPDLYFADYDSTETGIGEPPANDLNDRLLVNDGRGFFNDESFTRMTSDMLLSAFGVQAKIADMNGDGAADVVKDTALQAPQYVAVAYNDPGNIGYFNIFQNNFHSFAPYHIDIGDLNNDARLDLVVGDDNADRYRYNLGNDALNRVIWGTAKKFTFLDGKDDGFPGNAYVADLDHDGWNDVLVTDFDVDLPGCSRRTHIYHNPGGTPGAEILLVEEVEKTGSGGWKGAKGFLVGDLKGTYDVAIFDLDDDGDLDILLGRCTGTFLWLNQLVCQADLGYGGPGDSQLSLCGKALSSGNSAHLLLEHAPPSAPCFMIGSVNSNPTSIYGGTLVPAPPFTIVSLTSNPAGKITVPGIPGGGGPFSFYLQAVIPDATQPKGYQFSNAIRGDWLP
ncbi:MAG: VCBS repeat-containing protein [Planctomycetota bacterium]